MIDKSILEWIIPALKEQTTIKGDVPGHEFHGNQYADGSGGGGGESSSDGGGDNGGNSTESAIDKIAKHNQEETARNEYNATHVKPNDKVSAYVHVSPMAAQAKKPKVKVVGRVTTIDKNENGDQIARIEFEHGGKQRSAWINTAQDKWKKE